MGKRRLPGNPLTFDMDVWKGLSYGQHPEQSIDVWELNDLAPRAGWPAVLLFSDGAGDANSEGTFPLFGPLLARRGVLVARASLRWEAAWADLHADSLGAIDRLMGLQINPQRVGLWGVGRGGRLALHAAESLESHTIRAVVTVGVSPEPFQDAPPLTGRLSSEDRHLALSADAGLRQQQRAHRWLLEAIADQQRGSKWKFRKKKDR